MESEQLPPAPDEGAASAPAAAMGPGTPGRGQRWLLAGILAVSLALAGGYVIGQITSSSGPVGRGGPGQRGFGFPGGVPPGNGAPGAGFPGGGFPGGSGFPGGYGFPEGGFPVAAGTVRSVRGHTLELAARAGGTVIVTLGPATQIVDRSGAPVTRADLAVGTVVVVQGERSATAVTAARIIVG